MKPTSKDNKPGPRVKEIDPAASAEPYHTGYKKPPLHTRFKPGVSGNPRGKKKKIKSSIEVFADFLHKPRPFSQDGKTVKLWPNEIIPLVLLKGFIQHKPKITELYLDKVKEAEAFAIKVTKEPKFSWDDQDEAIMQFLKRTIPEGKDEIGDNPNAENSDDDVEKPTPDKPEPGEEK